MTSVSTKLSQLLANFDWAPFKRWPSKLPVN